MSGEHDFAIYETPVACRNCGRTIEAFRAHPKPCVGVHTPRHAADDYQGIAKRMRELGGQQWITTE